MGLFKKKTQNDAAQATANSTIGAANDLSALVIRSIREGVLVVDANGNIVLANPMASLMLGRNIDELIGINHASNVNLIDKSGNRLDESVNPISSSIRSGEVVERRDLSVLNTDTNKSVPISLIIAPTNGANSSVIVTFRDIAKELKEEQERTDFISTASHEMRTPVASIEGYLGLAMNPATATVDARAQQYLAKAHESSQHLGRLFQDLLDTTKLDDGQIRTHMEPVELVSVVREYAAAQMPNAQAKGLTYQFGNAGVEQNRAANLQQLIYASIDRDFLQEILNNLIENAIKYTPAGGITVSVVGDDLNAQIIVADTGIGIPRDEISHIFQKFYRVDNSDTREIGGTGLGLALVKQRVELMGGKIWAESEQGKGSRFIISLPRLKKEAYEQQRFMFENQQKAALSDQARSQAVQAFASGSAPVSQPAPAPVPMPNAQPAPQPQVQVAAQPMPAPAPAPTPTPAPVAQPAPQPQPQPQPQTPAQPNS